MHKYFPVWEHTTLQDLIPRGSNVASCFHSLSFVVPLILIRCHCLSPVVIRCHSLLFVGNCCHSLSRVVPLVITLCNSLSFELSLVCLFIKDPWQSLLLLWSNNYWSDTSLEIHKGKYMISKSQNNFEDKDFDIEVEKIKDFNFFRNSWLIPTLKASTSRAY